MTNYPYLYDSGVDFKFIKTSVRTPQLGDREAMAKYRLRPDLTEVPGSLRRKIEVYSKFDHHPAQIFEGDEQEKFMDTAKRMKKQVISYLV